MYVHFYKILIQNFIYIPIYKYHDNIKLHKIMFQYNYCEVEF